LFGAFNVAIPNLLSLALELVASAPGTGSTVSLSGTVVAGGYLTWAAAGAQNGAEYRYALIDGVNREECYGVYNSTANTLTRVTVIASVNGVAQTTPMNASANAVVGSVVTAADVVTPASMAGGYVNKFRNPGMDIAQRGTSGSVTSGTTAYTLDGWMVSATGHAVSWAQEYCQNLAATRCV
jgi:hypothetical protein